MMERNERPLQSYNDKYENNVCESGSSKTEV